ncbi:MAG: hypothetical protein ACRDFX_03445 [Chloroflexota bacterium]
MQTEDQIRTRNRPDEATILRALAALEDKLTVIINAGLSAVTATISSLQQQHSAALLEQAKLNGSFADRDRVEQLNRTVDRHATELLALGRQDTIGIDERRQLRAEFTGLAESITSNRIHFMSGATGYAFTGFFIILGAVISFVLTHVLS